MQTIEQLVGSRIKNIRSSNNETQQQLGLAVGVIQQSVAAWESGKSMPSVISLIRLALHYNITTDSIIGVMLDIQEND